MKKVIIFVILTVCAIASYSQTDSTEKLKVKINVDLVSKFVWRGLSFDDGVNVQPFTSLTYKDKLQLGIFSSFGLQSQYRELDLTLSYPIKNFNISVTDYFIPVDSNFNFNNSLNPKYFDLNFSPNNIYNPHSVLLDINYSYKKLLLTSSVILLSNLDQFNNGLQRYTMYFEAKYQFEKIDFFIGGINGKSYFYFAENPGIINTGMKIKSNIKFKNNEIPVSSSLIYNCQSEKLNFVFSINF